GVQTCALPICLLPGPETRMHAPVRAGSLTGAVGEQPEREPARRVTRVDRHVPRIGADCRSRAPQEVPTDPTLEGDEVDAEIGAEQPQLGRVLDPSRHGNEVVALR